MFIWSWTKVIDESTDSRINARFTAKLEPLPDQLRGSCVNPWQPILELWQPIGQFVQPLQQRRSDLGNHEQQHPKETREKSSRPNYLADKLTRRIISFAIWIHPIKVLCLQHPEALREPLGRFAIVSWGIFLVHMYCARVPCGVTIGFSRIIQDSFLFLQ